MTCQSAAGAAAAVSFPSPLTIHECAEAARVHYDTVRKAIRRGDLRAYRVPGGREIHVRPEDLEAWLYAEPIAPQGAERPHRPQSGAGRQPAPVGSVADLDAIEGAHAA